MPVKCQNDATIGHLIHSPQISLPLCFSPFFKSMLPWQHIPSSLLYIRSKCVCFIALSLVLEVLDLKCLSCQYLVYPFWTIFYPQFLFNAYKVQKEVKLLVYNCLKLRSTSSDRSGGAHTKQFKMKQQVTK